VPDTSTPHPSSAQLLCATLLATIIAGVLLVTIVLPAEYGLDPTGIGGALGLFRPAASDASIDATGSGDNEGAAAAGSQAGEERISTGAVAASRSLRKSPTPYRTDEMSLTLQSGEGAEIKAAMKQGERLVFTWTATGGGVDVDMHSEFLGARAGESISYWKDELQTSGHGSFEAPAVGNHGWFWQNLTDDPVTVTVKVGGFYEKLFRP
jgi:hypothetical protein